MKKIICVLLILLLTGCSIRARNQLVEQSGAWRDCRTRTSNDCQVFGKTPEVCNVVENGMIPPNMTKAAKISIEELCENIHDLQSKCWDYATEAEGCP